MKDLYNNIPFAFDDVPIISNVFAKETKRWELYFDEYFDVEKNDRVDGYCVFVVKEWDEILIKKNDENADYQVTDEISIPDCDLIVLLEYDYLYKQLRMVISTEGRSVFYYIVFVNAIYDLKKGKLLSEIDYHNVSVSETLFLRNKDIVVLCLDGYWDIVEKRFYKQSCAIVFNFVKAYIQELNSDYDKNDYRYMRFLNYEINQILDINIAQRRILLTAIVNTGEIIRIMFEDAYVIFYEKNLYTMVAAESNLKDS